MVNLEIENELWHRGIKYIAGVDEAGRGPLAGPVVAAAVIFPENINFKGLEDSKKLTEKLREELFDIIKQTAVSVGVGIVNHSVIDEINILNATFRAMHMAIDQLNYQPEYLLIDGPYFAGANIPFSTIIRGDTKSASVAAASIIAKVTRDRLMREYDMKFPEYGFSRHKGYATYQHIEAIKKFGLCQIHRKSFRLSCLANLANE